LGVGGLLKLEGRKFPWLVVILEGKKENWERAWYSWLGAYYSIGVEEGKKFGNYWRKANKKEEFGENWG